MLSFIKNLFKKSQPDNTLEELKTLFRGNWKKLSDDEQAVLMLRLTGLSHDNVAIALDTTINQVKQIELQILEKLRKK